MKPISTFAGLAGVLLLGGAAVACSAAAGPNEGKGESVGAQTSALVCAQAVTQQVPITGLYQDVYEVKGEFKCTGETGASGKADVTLTPLGDDKWSVSVSFGSKSSFPFTQTATEKDGLLQFYGSYVAGSPGLNSVCGGMSAQSGSVRVKVENGTIYVRQYCHWQSGAGACDRHYDLSATVPLACATDADAGGANDASAPDDASVESDAAVTEDGGASADASPAEDSGGGGGGGSSEPDASNGSDGSGEGSGAGAPPSEPPAPPATGADGGASGEGADGGGSGGCQSSPTNPASAFGGLAIGFAFLLVRSRVRRRVPRA